MKGLKVTRETLERDRARRQRERDNLAAQYDSAANIMLEHDYATGENHSAAIAHLHSEAQRWRS